MMKSIISTFMLLCSVSVVASATAIRYTSGGITRNPLFGIRAGALFGGSKDDKKAAATTEERKKYPPMSQEEIEKWMENIPVFAVTDTKGAGIVLKPDSNSSVFYFFLSPQMANATLNQLKESGGAPDMDLRISAFSLGKIWFQMLNNEKGSEVTLKAPGSDTTETSTNVEYRLVPDTRDLLGARMLLTMNPEDGEKLKNGEQMTPEIAQKAIQKAMTESPKFNATYNEIPVFMIGQMRMQKQSEDKDAEPITLLPMYFSLQSMVGTWQQFTSQAGGDLQGMEPAINLMSLHDLVAMMKTECEIDFRNVVLIPSMASVGEDGAEKGGPGAGDVTGITPDPMASMGGSTLGDL